MVIQHVLKGIGGIDDDAAARILDEGIQSNWLRNGRPEFAKLSSRLTAEELEWHLNHFEEVYPLTGQPYSDLSPFISTTAGVFERDLWSADILPFDPLETAVRFATNGFTQDGFVYYAYLFVLERPSIPHVAFSEEIRSLIAYPWVLPFHHEGEIAAKIQIASVQIEKYEKYEIEDDGHALAGSMANPNYQSPWEYANVRGLAALAGSV